MVCNPEYLIDPSVRISCVALVLPDPSLFAMVECVKRRAVVREDDPELLPQTAGGCAGLLSSENGFQTALDLIRSTLSEDLRETAYALAVEVAAADGRPGQAELRILEENGRAAGRERVCQYGSI